MSYFMLFVCYQCQRAAESHQCMTGRAGSSLGHRNDVGRLKRNDIPCRISRIRIYAMQFGQMKGNEKKLGMLTCREPDIDRHNAADGKLAPIDAILMPVLACIRAFGYKLQ